MEGVTRGSSSVRLRGHRDGVFGLAMAEFVVIATIRFLMASEEGLVITTFEDERLRGLQEDVHAPCFRRGERPRSGALGELVPLPDRLKDAIAIFGVFDKASGSRFDPALSCLALRRSDEIDWN